MSDSFKNVMFDETLKLAHSFSLLYRDLSLLMLCIIIFHSQIPLLITWYLVVVYFLVYMYVIFYYEFYIYIYIYIYIVSYTDNLDLA